MDQYYEKQGISLESLQKQLSREEKEKKDTPIQAEWIAKERLTLMESKERKDQEPERKPAQTKEVSHKIQAPDSELLGSEVLM